MKRNIPNWMLNEVLISNIFSRNTDSAIAENIDTDTIQRIGQKLGVLDKSPMKLLHNIRLKGGYNYVADKDDLLCFCKACGVIVKFVFIDPLYQLTVSLNNFEIYQEIIIAFDMAFSSFEIVDDGSTVSGDLISLNMRIIQHTNIGEVSAIKFLCRIKNNEVIDSKVL